MYVILRRLRKNYIMAVSEQNKSRNFVWLLLYAICSLFFLCAGTLASGLLLGEENFARAIFLFVVALLGAIGSLFFFILAMKVLSPKPKDPFMPTLP
jgi:hypothetical protein